MISDLLTRPLRVAQVSERVQVDSVSDSEERLGLQPRFRQRLHGSRYTLLRGFWIVFQDAPVAAVIRALVALAAGAATGPLLVLATERFIATALDVADGQLAFAAIAMPVIILLALLAVEILEAVVRDLADARIEIGLRNGFRSDLTEKRARLEYRYIEDPRRSCASRVSKSITSKRLFDEPTASIDPLEEQAVYERFMRIAAGRMAIIVTHRLASARLADRILVLEGGRIVEDGTHGQLLARRGLYHRMFTAQAAWYRRSDDS